MPDTEIAVIVLAAGLGTRMKSDRPKVLHPVAGRPMIGHVLATTEALAPARRVVVVGNTGQVDAFGDAFGDAETVVQDPPRGTGDAVAAARDALAGFTGDIVVVYGDTPLLRPETLLALIAARRGPDDPAAVVLGFRPDDAAEYGRLVTDAAGGLRAIVEFRDATPEVAAIGLCNGGIMAFDGAVLFDLVARIGNDNAKGEYYLTDVIALARAAGRVCAVVEGEPEDVLGVNSRAELAAAEAVLQSRLRARAMAAGATLIDPATTWLCHDTRLGRDVVVEPNVVFGPGVEVGDRVTIRAFSHLEGCRVAAGATIGPFARLRPGAEIADGARIGNFVEVKQARIEAGAKVNHLSYIGDARVGAGANIGAGTITCNYDGFDKHRTEIGAGAFIGSNTALVAPVTVGAGAVVGAGSVIADDVAPDALALTRAPQGSKPGWAAAYRAGKQAKKDDKP